MLLIKFHPERELRLIQEFCRDGYTYDVVAPSFRIAADWDFMIRSGSFQPPLKMVVLPQLVKEYQLAGNFSYNKPGLSTEQYEQAILVDKRLSKWGTGPRTNFFLNCYVHIIDSVLHLARYNIILGEISSAFDLLLFRKAKKMGVSYTYFIASPLTPNSFYFIDDEYQIKDLDKICKEERIRQEQMPDNLMEEVKAKPAPGYMQFNNQMKLNNLFRKNQLVQNRKSRLWNFIKTYLSDARLSTDFVPGLDFYLVRASKWYRFFVLKVFGKMFWQKEVEKDNYVLFLQYEPEITTSLYAYPFTSQKKWIEIVLANLEPERILYVKEHPAMFSQRNLSFYSFLRNQKQIRLVDPGIPSYLLIKEARAVLTLNSTVGIESLKSGTPVISFGKAYYNVLPEVIKWSELKAANNWKYLGDIEFATQRALRDSYEVLERSIKRIEYKGCLNDHRFDSNVITSANMRSVKKGIEQYVGEDRTI